MLCPAVLQGPLCGPCTLWYGRTGGQMRPGELAERLRMRKAEEEGGRDECTNCEAAGGVPHVQLLQLGLQFWLRVWLRVWVQWQLQ